MTLLNQVVESSPTLAKPHHLLAKAMEKSHDYPRALGEYQAACHLCPADPQYRKALLAFLNKSGRSAQASEVLDASKHRKTLRIYLKR